MKHHAKKYNRNYAPGGATHDFRPQSEYRKS